MVMEFDEAWDQWHLNVYQHYKGKEIWEAIKQTYSKVNATAHTYQVKTQISTTKKGILICNKIAESLIEMPYKDYHENKAYKGHF